MKKLFILLVMVVAFLTMSTASVKAQDQLYVYKNGAVVYQRAVSDIDSISFTAPQATSYGYDLNRTVQYGTANYDPDDKNIVYFAIVAEEGVWVFKNGAVYSKTPWTTIRDNWVSYAGITTFTLSVDYRAGLVKLTDADASGMWSYIPILKTVSTGPGYPVSKWSYNGNTPLIATTYKIVDGGAMEVSYTTYDGISHTYTISQKW